MKSVLHEFISGDRLHPELASIHGKFNVLEKRMKLEGYVPNLDFVLHNVGLKQKEMLLLRRSEKLAIAFGMIKSPPGTLIRVLKNLESVETAKLPLSMFFPSFSNSWYHIFQVELAYPLVFQVFAYPP